MSAASRGCRRACPRCACMSARPATSAGWPARSSSRSSAFNVEAVDIEGDDELLKRFAIEVPVVEVEGEVVTSGQIDLDAVRAAVNAARIASTRRAATGGTE